MAREDGHHAGSPRNLGAHTILEPHAGSFLGSFLPFHSSSKREKRTAEKEQVEEPDRYSKRLAALAKPAVSAIGMAARGRKPASTASANAAAAVVWRGGATSGIRS